jgi:hypothetical protein
MLSGLPCDRPDLCSCLQQWLHLLLLHHAVRLAHCSA